MTDLDKAIEAAVGNIVYAIFSEIDEVAGRSYLPPPECIRPCQEVAKPFLRQHIGPVVEKLKAHHSRTAGWLGSAEVKGANLERELTELKAMVREYIGADDGLCEGDMEATRYCQKCGNLMQDDKNEHCQDSECIAFKLREAVK